MLTFFARVISFITNPLFILFPVPYLLIYRMNNNSIYALKWSLFSLFFVFLLGIFTMYEVKRGVFTDLDVSKQEQRPLLYFFVGIVAFLYLISLVLLKGPPVLFLTVLGIMIGLLLVSLINTRVKASLHVATITAVMLTTGILYGVNLLAYLLIPVIAWARVRIKRHTVQEAIVGGVAGTFLTLVMYIIIKYFFSDFLFI